MAKNNLNPKVDVYIARAKNWQEETEQLRDILIDCGLAEDLKWGKPCYAYNKSNIAIIQGFKEYFALLFFKGVLLKDPKGVLVRTGENTHVGRQLRFANVREIAKMKPIIKAYVNEAIAIEKVGLKVERKANQAPALPEEFKAQLNKNLALKSAFKALTPGRQRAYNIYFSQAKQPQTRIARIEKCIPQILNGKGLND